MQVIGGDGDECTAVYSPVLKAGQCEWRGLAGHSEPGYNGDGAQCGWRVGRCGEQLTGLVIYFLRGCDPGRGRGRFEGIPRVSLVPRSTSGQWLGSLPDGDS